MSLIKQSNLLRKRDFYTAFESQDKNFTQLKWEKLQILKNKNFFVDLKKQIDPI